MFTGVTKCRWNITNIGHYAGASDWGSAAAGSVDGGASASQRRSGLSNLWWPTRPYCSCWCLPVWQQLGQAAGWESVEALEQDSQLLRSVSKSVKSCPSLVHLKKSPTLTRVYKSYFIQWKQCHFLHSLASRQRKAQGVNQSRLLVFYVVAFLVGSPPWLIIILCTFLNLQNLKSQCIWMEQNLYGGVVSTHPFFCRFSFY